MSKQTFTNKDPRALEKLDELWRQFRNSIVMDGREFEVNYEKADGVSKVEMTFGLTSLERHKSDELRDKLAAKRAEREKAEQDKSPPAIRSKTAASPPIASATGGSGPTPKEPSK